MWESDHKEGRVWKTDVVELWCCRRLLRIPWTARRSNQSILKEISPEYSLEGLMPKLKRQYFGHLMRRTDSLGKTLMLGKTEGRRRRGWQRMNDKGWMALLTQQTWVWVNFGSWWWTEKPGVLQSMGMQRVGHDWVTEQQQQPTLKTSQDLETDFYSNDFPREASSQSSLKDLLASCLRVAKEWITDHENSWIISQESLGIRVGWFYHDHCCKTSKVTGLDMRTINLRCWLEQQKNL